jgi:signal transduction histidine kinase
MLETYFNQMSLPERIAKLRQITHQVDQMTQLLDAVLTLSKANAGKIVRKPERIQLKVLCERVWNDFRHIAQQTHSIEFSYVGSEDEVVLDPDLIHYILVNLLSNAVKYSPENGRVHFDVINDGRTITFRISDNGIGIPEMDQASLFQPFHRGTNTQMIGGTGLGLSIVKTYVEAHGGSIRVSSTEGQGTTFTVHIPIV